MAITLADCITGRPIREGDRVVAYLMTEARDEENITYLICDSADRYRIASLPIEGIWDGFHVAPDEGNSMAVRSALFAAASKAQNLEELQQALYTHSIQDIPRERMLFQKNADLPPLEPVKMKFSLFVTTPESLDLMYAEPSVKSRYPIDAEAQRKLIEPLLEGLQPHLDALDSPDQDTRDDAYHLAQVYGNAVFFSTGDLDPEDAQVPYACKRTLAKHEGIISDRLNKFLGENKLAGYKATREYKQSGELPQGYDEVFKGLHSLKLMTEAMHWLDVTIQPAAQRSKGERNLDRVALLRAMLVKEMSEFIDGIEGYEEPAKALEMVDSILNPLKADVATMVKERTLLSRQVPDGPAL